MTARTLTSIVAVGLGLGMLALSSLVGCTDSPDLTAPAETTTLDATTADPLGAPRLHPGPRERLANQLTRFLGVEVSPGDLAMKDVRTVAVWVAPPVVRDAVRRGGHYVLVTIDRPDIPSASLTFSIPDELQSVYMGAAFGVVVNEAHGTFVRPVERLLGDACVSVDVLVRNPDLLPETSCAEGDTWDPSTQCLRRQCLLGGNCVATIADCRVDSDCSACEEPEAELCEYLACQDGFCTAVWAEVPAGSPCPEDECFLGDCQEEDDGVYGDLFGG